MLPRAERITTAREFRAIRGRGVRWQSPSFFGFTLASREPTSRLGVIVSAKFGKSVKRKRASRVLRESFRQATPDLGQPVDVVLIARPVILRKTTLEVTRELTRFLHPRRS